MSAALGLQYQNRNKKYGTKVNTDNIITQNDGPITRLSKTPSPAGNARIRTIGE
ncbi:MAG: hypothetical protein ACJAR3_002221 [Roseivirga sp.]|jgi:hypothetical protein